MSLLYSTTSLLLLCLHEDKIKAMIFGRPPLCEPWEEKSGSNVRIQPAHPQMMTPAWTAATATTPFTFITSRWGLHAVISASINPFSYNAEPCIQFRVKKRKKDMHRFPLLVGMCKVKHWVQECLLTPHSVSELRLRALPSNEKASAIRVQSLQNVLEGQS